MIPYAGLAYIAAGFFRAWKEPSESRLFVYLSVTAILVPILVFFNLFAVHEYYFISVAPFRRHQPGLRGLLRLVRTARKALVHHDSGGCLDLWPRFPPR